MKLCDRNKQKSDWAESATLQSVFLIWAKENSKMSVFFIFLNLTRRLNEFKSKCFRRMSQHVPIPERTFRKLHYSAKYCCRIVSIQAQTFVFFFFFKRHIHCGKDAERRCARETSEINMSVFKPTKFTRTYRKSFGHQMALQLQPWN